MFKILQVIHPLISSAQIYNAASQIVTQKNTHSSSDGYLLAKVAKLNLGVVAPLLALTLLVGCATDNTLQTASPAAQSIACDADSDAFCAENDKDSAARLNRQGVEQAERGGYDLALGLFQDAIKLDASNPEFYYNLGVAYNYKQMLVETEAAYIAGAALPSSNPQHVQYFAKIYFNLACLYALQGKKDAAFEQLEKLFVADKNLLFHWVEGDADLASLRDDPRYKELMARQAGRNTSPENSGRTEEPGNFN